MTNVQLALIVSVVTTMISVIAMQCKKMTHVRALQLTSNSLLTLQYFLTDNVSAAGVCMIAILHVIITIILRHKGKRFPISLTVFFMVCYVAVNLISYEKAPDGLTAVAACIFALSVVQAKNEYYRICSTANCMTWLIFDLWSHTYTAVILHLTLFIIDIVTIIRIDGKMWIGRIKGIKK